MKLTNTQKMILTLLLHRGESGWREVTKGDSALDEALHGLIANDLVVRPRGQSIALSEEGAERATAIQSYTQAFARRHQMCPACVRVFCVCEIRLVCLGDGPHDLGCHGSHE